VKAARFAELKREASKGIMVAALWLVYYRVQLRGKVHRRKVSLCMTLTLNLHSIDHNLHWDPHAYEPFWVLLKLVGNEIVFHKIRFLTSKKSFSLLDAHAYEPFWCPIKSCGERKCFTIFAQVSFRLGRLFFIFSFMSLVLDQLDENEPTSNFLLGWKSRIIASLPPRIRTSLERLMNQRG
jgi:hypothetical protein